MLTYFILLTGTFLVATYSIHERLSKIQRTQLFHTQWLQELMLKIADVTQYRKAFKHDSVPPADINPVMLVPYIHIMTSDQNLRFRQWVLAKQHDPFTVDEIRSLEKALAEKEGN